jgi:hypothetical protein
MKKFAARSVAIAGIAALGILCVPMAASAATAPHTLTGTAPHALAGTNSRTLPIGGRDHPLAIFGNNDVNCSNPTEGTENNQEYLDIACSDINATSWGLEIFCSNGTEPTAGLFTTFENVQLFCPAGTTITSADIVWTT